MGDYSYTVAELTTQIKKLGKMNLAHLGNDADQNTYIYYYLTQAMWRYVSIAYIVRTSDPLVVASNGYVTFQRASANIEDLYEPLRLLVTDEAGTEASPRTSFSAPSGWYRESANSRIHIKGAGSYVMQYKAYPAKASSGAQVLDWPATSYDLLIFETIGKIKESVDQPEESAKAYAVADKLIPILLKTQEDSSRKPANLNVLQFYRR